MLPYKDSLLLLSRYLQQLVMESLGKEFDLDGNRVIFFPYSSQFTVTDISEPLGFRFFIHYCFCLTYKFPMTGESRANCIWQQRKH